MLQIDISKVERIGAIMAKCEDEIRRETGVNVSIMVNGAENYKVFVVETVLATIAQVFKISTLTIISKNRELTIVWARQISCWFLVTKCGMKPEEVAAFISRDRTTVYHSVEMVNSLNGTDKEFSNLFDSCMTSLSIYFTKPSPNAEI